MAEVAKNVVSEPERPEPEELSLQQLIDTELALRVPPPNKSQTFTLDFLEAERKAAERCSPKSPPLIVIDSVVPNGEDSPILSQSPPSQVPDAISPSPPAQDRRDFVNGDGGVGEMAGATNEWTTVEEVALELTGEGGGDRAPRETSLEQSPDSKLTEITTSCVTNKSDGLVTEVTTTKTTTTTTQIHQEEKSEVETSVTDKKKKKKKTATENGNEVISAVKVKKSKKKKNEEKENHISVSTNGLDCGKTLANGDPPLSPSSLVIEDDLANVCVKNLKLNYVNETTKSFSGHVKSSEVPVPPTVSIRELRRSFGDIHKACEASEEEPPGKDRSGETMRGARSLGDLSRIDRGKPIVTGVSVKELAAAYWRTVSIDNNLNEHCNKTGRLNKSSFSKFDQLSKKTVLHVRSSDPAKASKTFSQGDGQTSSTCKACEKTVFAMEQIKAERAVWHKNCFRCQTCKKQLTVDTYSSHEGLLYCKPHFKDLFKPQVFMEQEEEPVRRKKPEMIIRENQPVELPPDVVRASDKSDLGLKELNLDVKSMFRVFEKNDETDGDLEKSPTTVSVKRSSSIMSKLAKFQKRGMDIGVSEEALNGFVYEESSSEESDESVEIGENGVVKSTKKLERPMSFGKIDDVKKNWESAGDEQFVRREKLREQKKEELQNLRSRLFMGKQVKMKELYEQAVAESEGKSVKKDEMNDIVRSDKAKVVREKFEKGETVHSDTEDTKATKKAYEEDIGVFEEGISKKSRSLFLEMDANVAKATPPPAGLNPRKKEVQHSKPLPNPPPPAEDIIRSSDKVEDVVVETADLSSKFKFFETYKPKGVEKKAFRITPPREGQVKSQSPEKEVYRDPNVVRCDEKLEDDTALIKSQTTSRMLSMFRQMEEQKEVLPEGPKPKKCFTPPPDFKASESEESDDEDEDDDEDDEESDDDGVVKSSYKVDDEYLNQAKTAARAKQLAAKFESWEPDQQSNNNAIIMLDSEQASIDSTQSLRAKFESLKSEQPKEKSRPKVNRFVESANPTKCAFCESKVYPLEKIETNGKIFHKRCFRCSYCNCILRMDSYTYNNGHLYCLPHFKQLFISKGNYDEGFGSNQHKRKWETPAN